MNLSAERRRPRRGQRPRMNEKCACGLNKWSLQAFKLICRANKGATRVMYMWMNGGNCGWFAGTSDLYSTRDVPRSAEWHGWITPTATTSNLARNSTARRDATNDASTCKALVSMFSAESECNGVIPHIAASEPGPMDRGVENGPVEKRFGVNGGQWLGTGCSARSCSWPKLKLCFYYSSSQVLHSLIQRVETFIILLNDNRLIDAQDILYLNAMTPKINLAGLQTETRNPRSTTIDQVSTEELCHILNEDDQQVPDAVKQCIPLIAAAIDALSVRVRAGGRVFYIGAGTSGR